MLFNVSTAYARQRYDRKICRPRLFVSHDKRLSLRRQDVEIAVAAAQAMNVREALFEKLRQSIDEFGAIFLAHPRSLKSASPAPPTYRPYGSRSPIRCRTRRERARTCRRSPWSDPCERPRNGCRG